MSGTGASEGHLRLGDVLGSGRTGEVRRGVHADGDSEVAVKIVTPALATDASIREGLRAAVAAVRTVTHPGVVRVHEVEITDEAAFVIMELAEGETLAAALARSGGLPTAVVARVATAVGDALEALARVDVVRDDLSPTAILLGDSPRAPEVRLFDGSVAQAVREASAHRTGEVVAIDLAYAAPERFEAGRLDQRSEVYTLGCVLFEALTAKAPFQADSLPALMYKHLHTPAPRLREVVPHLPPALDDILARALAKDPADRIRTPAELARAVDDAVRHAEAEPPSSPPRDRGPIVCGPGRTPRPEPGPPTKVNNRDVPRLILPPGSDRVPMVATPADWWLKQSTTVLAPDGTANIIASSEPLESGMTAAEFARTQGRLIAQEFPGFVEESLRPFPAFGSRDGWLRVFRWTPRQGVPMFQIQVYAVIDGRGWTATATTPQTLEHRHRATMEAVIAHVRPVPIAGESRTRRSRWWRRS